MIAKGYFGYKRIRPVPDVVAVLGYPQHGKSTLAGILSRLSGYPWAPTSRVILDFMSKLDGVDYGTNWHETVPPAAQAAFRRRLVQTGDALAHIRPHLFSEALFAKGVRIIDGIRRIEELNAWKLQLANENKVGMFVWVNRPDQELIKDNTTVTEADAYMTVVNTTLEDLEESARRILTSINWPGGDVNV